VGHKKLFFVLEQTTWEGIVYDKVVAKYRYRWIAYAVARVRNWLDGSRRYHVAELREVKKHGQVHVPSVHAGAAKQCGR